MSILKDTNSSPTFYSASRSFQPIEFQARTLENGLKVIYVPMATAGSACSNIVYNVGSCDELDHERGLAHQLEHAQHFDSKITDMELSAAILNATTSYYRTNYYMLVPYQFIKKVISQEAQRMKVLPPALLKNRLSGETIVILNEMEGSLTNDYRNLTMANMSECFRLAPNNKAVIGTKPTLFRSVELDGDPVLQFHDKNYTPDNATLCLAGPWSESTISIDDLHAHVQQEFGDITKQCKKESYLVEPQQEGMRSYTMPGQTTMMAMSFVGPPGLHEDSIALSALANCMTHRLEEKEKDGAWMQSAVMWERSRQKALFTNYLIGFQDPQLVKNVAIQMICGLQSDQQVTASELQCAKTELFNTWSSQLQSTQGVCDAFTESIALGYPNDINTKFQKLESLSIQDLTNVARKYLVETNCTTGCMLPYKVKPMPIMNYTVPDFQSVGNCFSAKLLEPPHFTTFHPLHKESLVQSGGSAITKVNGTLWKRDGLVWAGARFSPKVDTEWFALAMGNAIKDPRVKWEACGPGMVRVMFNCLPDALNEETLNLIWGNKSDYALAGKKGLMMKNGMAADINKYAENLTQNTIFELPQYTHTLEKAVDIVKNSPRSLVAVAPSDNHLSALQTFFQHDSEFQEFIPPPALKPSDHSVIEGKENIKVVVSQAIPNLSRQHKDFIPLKIASDILGYGFHGDLMHQIRIDHGLTYGSRSSLAPGYFTAEATFPPRNLDKGVADLMDVVQNKWRPSINEKEVDIQKTRLKLMPITLSDKPENFIKAHHSFISNTDLEACKLEDVLRAFDTHIDVNRLTKVMVG